MAKNKKYCSLLASICILIGAFKNAFTQGMSNLGIPSTRVGLVYRIGRGDVPQFVLLKHWLSLFYHDSGSERTGRGPLTFLFQRWHKFLLGSSVGLICGRWNP